MKTHFSEVLRQFRIKAGFPTAYRFYHDNGGAPLLKFSYRKYLHMEQGKLLPVFDRMGILLYALRLNLNSTGAIDLILAWIKTCTGDDQFDTYISPLLKERPKNIANSPLHKIIDKALSQARVFITPAQMGVIAANRTNHLCFLAISNDTSTWTPKNLAAALKLSVAATKKALRDLAAAKLLKEVKPGLYKCPSAGSLMEFPFFNVALDAYQKISRYNNDLVANGKPVYMRGSAIRADATDFPSFFPMLSLSNTSAHTYSTYKRTSNTALFRVETKVTKLMDF